MVGFLKKLPEFPICLGSGNLFDRIVIIMSLTSLIVGFSIFSLFNSFEITPYDVLMVAFLFNLKVTAVIK